MSTTELSVSSKEMLCKGLNAEQQEAVLAPIDGAVQVLAGAGTGKTELITRRFAKLTMDLQSQNDFNATEHLWVSTFTQKAAQEMKERISHYLSESNGIALHPRAWIGTFHSLCQRILQQHGAKIGYNERFQILSNVELDLQREKLLQRILDGEMKSLPEILKEAKLPCSPNCLNIDYLNDLNLPAYDGLFEEILFSLVPHIKTAGLSPAEFYHHALEKTPAYAVLISTMPVSDPITKIIWTDHETYAQAWAHHLTPIRHPRFSFFPSEWDIEITAAKALRKQKNPPQGAQLLKDCLKPFYQTQSFIGYDGRKRNEPFSAITPDFSKLQKTTHLEKNLIEVVSAIYALYQNDLRFENAFDFDDLIQETIRLLRDFPAIQQEYQTLFAHFLVDEFQDSNGGQLQLIQCLSGKDHPRITVVGDKKQSIYGFRHAEPENLQILFQDLPHSQAITLKTNYRSQKPILGVANRITEMMDSDKIETLAPCPQHENEDGEAVCWFHIEAETTISEAQDLEVQWISETIADLVYTEKNAPQDIAVLVKNHRKALKIEAALESLGIPAIRQRNLGFFDTPVVQQAIALLEVAVDPHNDFALINLLQRKLNHHELYLLSKYRKATQKEMGLSEFSYYEALCDFIQHPKKQPDGLQAVTPLLIWFVSKMGWVSSQKDQMSPQHLFTQLIRDFALSDRAIDTGRQGFKAAKQLALLKKMLDYWTTRSQKPLSLATILDILKRYQAKNDLELPFGEEAFGENAVRIMTLHGAKGLQFPVVFLAGVDQSRQRGREGLLTIDPQYPGKQGFGLFLNRHEDEKTLKKLVYDIVWKNPRTREEELRLFYVGVTRAKSKLYLTSWPKSFGFTNPDFFQDLSIQQCSPNLVVWKSASEREQIQQVMQQRYPFNVSVTPISPFSFKNNTSSEKPLPIIQLDSLIHFSTCPTQGLLHHFYSQNASSSLLKPGIPFGVNLNHQAWVSFFVSKIETDAQNKAIYTLFPENGPWKEALLQVAFPEPSENQIQWEISAHEILESPSIAKHYEMLQNSTTDIITLLTQFLSRLEKKNAYPAPQTPVPCQSCDYQAICPHPERIITEDSH